MGLERKFKDIPVGEFIMETVKEKIAEDCELFYQLNPEFFKAVAEIDGPEEQ